VPRRDLYEAAERSEERLRRVMWVDHGVSA
jgi:hypothetical protein